MKKNLTKLFSLFCTALILLMPIGVFAEEEAKPDGIEIVYDRESGKVEIGGVAPSGTNPDEAVRLIILKPETDIDDLKSGKTDFTKVGVHISETALNEDNTFEFEAVIFPDTLPVGKYLVRVAAGEKTFDDVILYATIEQAENLVNGAETPEEMKELIESYNDVYNLDLSEKSDYSLLSDEGKDFVLANMCLKEYEDADDIKETFMIYTQLYRVYECPWGVVQSVVETHSSLLGLDLSDYNDAGDNKTDICKALCGNLYEDKEAFAEAFKETAEEYTKERPSKDKGSSGGSSGGVSMQVASGEKEEQKAESEAGTEPFSDLSAHGWAKDSIYKLYSKGIVNGKADGVFAPNDAITRAEAVKMIILALSELSDGAKADFSDVAQDSWMAPFVATAKEKGFVNGYSEDYFGAFDAITREDFAVIIVRAAEAGGMAFNSANSKFADDKAISDYAKDAIYKLKAKGVISGVGDNEFMAKGQTTRAQAAKIIAALLD